MEKQLLEQVFERSFHNAHDNWKALCPFHDERTPSFYVHHTDLIGHCFGCGVGGAIDVLAAKYRGTTVEEARRALDIDVKSVLERADAKNRRKAEPTRFPKSWLAPWKREIHKYVLDRKLSEGILRRAGTRYDSALKRQVFPHFHSDGGLLGAIGRTCRTEDPKWYFYWGYDKGQALYTPFGLEPLRPTLLVEGVFDYLWVAQNYEGKDINIAASLGTAITSAQHRELTSYSSSVILGLDNDKAGREASERSRKLLRASTKLEYVEWPPYAKDWMDLSKEQIHDMLENRVNYVQRRLIRNTKTSSSPSL